MNADDKISAGLKQRLGIGVRPGRVMFTQPCLPRVSIGYDPDFPNARQNVLSYLDARREYIEEVHEYCPIVIARLSPCQVRELASQGYIESLALANEQVNLAEQSAGRR